MGRKLLLEKAHVPGIRSYDVYRREGGYRSVEKALKTMSPDQVMQKRYGIFIHQSQKDMVPFQGSDSREFWQRAEERNENTANFYAQLGLTHYAAMEAFVKWKY
jgi:glucosamine-6-phosphate deaminase